MKKYQVLFGALVLLLALSIGLPVAKAVDLELLAELPPSHGITVQRIEAIQVLDSNPNEIVFATQNQGSYCGGGTPASAWKMILDANTGEVTSVELKQSLAQIQNIRGSLFESLDGTLFTGGGWCGNKPPYFSMDGGEIWQPANRGVHPPNSTFSFCEFNGHVYAGTGYCPFHGQVYRWLGDAGVDHWELIFDIAPPRSIVGTMSVYENQMFVGSQIYWWSPGGCENSVPVYVSADGNTFNATTGIPPCYSVADLLVAGNRLVARAFNVFDSTEVYMYCWNNDLGEWEEIGPYNLGFTWNYLVSHNGIIYAYGQAPSDTSAGIYQSVDMGQTWNQIAVLEDPDVSSMTIHGHTLYLGTRADANNTAYIYRMVLIKEVAIDIKPGYCPNLINVNSKGVLPVAVLGTYDLDVTQIDPASVRLMDVAPLRSNLEDVGTPFEPFVGKEDAYDCNDFGPDTFMDLSLKFDTQTVLDVIGDVNDGDVLVLELTGKLYDGNSIKGEDVVVILKKGKN